MNATIQSETLRSHHPLVMGDRGMVVAGHPKASEAGAAILRSGGNAMDAAIAAAATLAIAIPFMNGLGGDAIALHGKPDGDVTAINGSGATPRALSVGALRNRGMSAMPQRGPIPVTVAAETMRILAEKGWRSFYSGDLARQWLAEARDQGVLIDLEHLAAHRTSFERALSTMWRERRVHVAPPNSQGLALLAMLALTEAQPAAAPCDESDPLIDPAAYLSRKSVAFAMRDSYCADQRRVRLPPDLLSPDRLRKLRLDAGSAMSRAGGGDTSTLVVVDAAGHAVSWVQSLFDSFGSGVARVTGSYCTIVPCSSASMMIRSAVCVVDFVPSIRSARRW